jgi:hypothetical protein
MRAQLLNCPINYEEGDDEPTKRIMGKPVVAKQSVT